MVRHYLKGAVAGGLMKGVALLLAFTLQLVAARVMGAEWYGEYTYAFAWVGILAVLLLAGTDGAAVRFVAEFDALDERSRTLMFLRWSYQCMKNNIKLVVPAGLVLACSEDEDLQLARKLQHDYQRIGIVQCANNPLGNKWRFAVACARKLSPKAIMITGSDDLVSADYLVNNYNILMQDPFGVIGMVGPRIWYVADCRQGVDEMDIWRVAYCNGHHHQPLGAGRLYRADFLDGIDWKIFEPALESCLDDKGYHQVLKSKLNIYCPTFDDGFVLSLKGDWTAMNSLDVILSAESIVASKVERSEKGEILNTVKDSLVLLSD